MSDIVSLVGVDHAGSLGNLSPAFKVLLQQMADDFNHIKFARERCRGIIRRAVVILNGVNGNTRNDQDGVIATLQKKLEDVRVTLRKLADISFFKALLRFEDIDKDIERAYRQLADCAKLFPMSDISSHVQAQKQATVADQDTLRAYLQILSGNYEEICRRLDIHNDDQVNQAMAVMERGLRNVRTTSDRDIPVEVQIILRCFECIKSTTGRSAPKQGKWLITEYDLDYCGTIGGGGFATVSKARFRGTMVAVKTFRDPANMREILASEVEIWSRLHNDHIVPFYGASVLTSPHFIVSRYMHNGNLVQYLAVNPRADRTKLLFEVSLGMYFLHEEDIVHGDLKGVNVLVDDAGKACITDFGLSKVRSSGTTVSEAGKVAGTLRYLAPEALKGQPLSFETDVYAFGMLTYEVFTGEVPFIMEPDQLVAEGCVELQRPMTDKVYERGFNDAHWQLLSDCICREPSARPRFKMIQEQLREATLTDQSGAQDKSLTDWGLTVLNKMPSSSDKGKSTLVEHHSTISERTASRVAPRSAESWMMCASPTLNDNTTHPFKQANAAWVEQPGPSHEISISRNSGIVPEILPMCIVVTHKYFDVPFGISSRKPGMYLDALQWQPIVADKGTLLYEQGDKFLCKNDTGKGQYSWELRGNEVMIHASSFNGVCHFRDAQTAEMWFKLQLGYVQDGSVRGWETTTGDWFRTERSWRRLERGKIQGAAVIETAPKVVPTDHAWSDVNLPRRCVITSRTATEIVCTTNSGKQPGRLSCRLDAPRIVFETRRTQGNKELVIAREETYPSPEYAELTFNVLKTVLERSAEKKPRSLFCFSLST